MFNKKKLSYKIPPLSFLRKQESIKISSYLYRFRIKCGMTLFFFFTFSFFVFTFSSSAQAADLSLSPSSGTYAVGNSFNLNVDIIISGESVDGVEAVLSFDPTVLQVNSITTGSLFSSYPSKTYDNSAGTISIAALAEIGVPITQGGSIATITFEGIAQGTTEVTFDSEGSDISESETSNEILQSVFNGTYIISSSSTTTTDTTDSGVGGTDDTTYDENGLPVTGNTQTTIILLVSGISLLSLGWRFAWKKP